MRSEELGVGSGQQFIFTGREVWLTQLTDALTGLQDEGNAELQPEFAASLRRSLEQARSGESVGLATFREQLGR